MASSPTMTNSTTTSGGDHEFAELRHLLTCDNPTCGNTDPRERCSRCETSYYCSVDCQRTHWKTSHQQTCVPIETQRAEWVAKFSVPASALKFGSRHDETSAGDETCSICIGTIKNPYVLPKCAHVFCFACLCEYQGKRHGPNQDAKSCPLCRAPIEQRVFGLEVGYAILLWRRACFLSEANEAEERDVLQRLAKKKVDMILEVGTCEQRALFALATFLTYAPPLAAVKLFQLCLSLKGCEPNQYVEELVRAAVDGSNDDTESIRNWYSRYGDRAHEGWGSFLCEIHFYSAEVLEAAGIYDLSQAEYERAASTAARCPPSSRIIGGIDVLRKAHLGLARIPVYHGDYQMVIDRLSTLLLQRETGGAHKLMAEALLAMAENPSTSGKTVTATTVPCTYSATLAGAIEVMYKGFVYERQWDDKNKQVNRVFLQELLDKQRDLQELVDQTAAIQLTE